MQCSENIRKIIINVIQLSIGDYDNYKPFLPLNETDIIIMGKKSSLKNITELRNYLIKIKIIIIIKS